MVSSGDCDSASVVKPLMSQNSTDSSTRLPPSENPESCRSCATSGAAKRRIISFCWSRNRFFSRLAPVRALCNTGLAGLWGDTPSRRALPRTTCEAAQDVVDAFQRRGGDDRKIAQLQVLLQLGQHGKAVELRHLHVEQQ